MATISLFTTEQHAAVLVRTLYPEEQGHDGLLRQALHSPEVEATATLVENELLPATLLNLESQNSESRNLVPKPINEISLRAYHDLLQLTRKRSPELITPETLQQAGLALEDLSMEPQVSTIPAWTHAYTPFIMGGNVNQPIFANLPATGPHPGGDLADDDGGLAGAGPGGHQGQVLVGGDGPGPFFPQSIGQQVAGGSKDGRNLAINQRTIGFRAFGLFGGQRTRFADPLQFGQRLTVQVAADFWRDLLDITDDARGAVGRGMPGGLVTAREAL